MYRGNKTRPARSNGGWKKRGSRNNNNSRFGGRGRFSGEKIDINRFINKAEKVEEMETFKPKYSFFDLKINDRLKRAIKERGFNDPTSIQEKSIPFILQGRDVIGLANTGTGKTAAFLIPMINKVLNNPQEKVLIVVPVRELAVQIQDEFRELTKQLKILSTVVVGGANIQRQIHGLRRQPNVVIGTPGRLKDLIDKKKLDLKHFGNVVLDEADRMLDMGFINDIKLFLSLLREKRQTMLFSATFSRQIENLVQDFLKTPERISLKTRETSDHVDQDIIKTNNKDKVEVLKELLTGTAFEKVLIFTKTKHGADNLCRKLHQNGLKSDAIHGNKAHNKRQRVLQNFKQNNINILVATDVAARGLDIPNVSHVINFDLPATYDDYVHRIGRTGRADKNGIALTFVD